ncbi:endonuclease/exonuclease/phosphatase family protein [Oricola indica]|jgi:endonuclease/exonuclease/phosphatase family metal-dependent hydrolase|uniref:endonuclease/exonuclease/phosphatase family protein n=1 Tax=Oricola indica TaxID=2872591 RepID=UPI001CBE2946|nr:endonuclease/exonuclease/phosphatase family protein [Oricola indica]
MRIATFNVQNMRLRRTDDGVYLTGARDMDEPATEGPAARAVDMIDRRLTAEILADADADVVGLQEVFDRDTLDYFHDRYLLPTGAAPYPHRDCLPGNDGRGFDVALMSRIAPKAVESHATLTPSLLGLDNPSGRNPDEPVFRRDCLSADVGPVTLYICHFKAPYPDPDIAWRARRLEALAVRELIEKRFAGRDDDYWLILGDLNEPGREERSERAIAPLLGGFSVDLVARMPEARQWSYHLEEADIYSRPDAMFASPALASDFPDTKPRFLRRGLGHDTARFDGERLEGVGYHRPHASDHAALVIEFEGL